MGIILRQGATGAILEGENDGDTLRWNATTASWDAGEPGTALPDGEYAGQPLAWDGVSEWVQSTSLVLDAIAGQPLGQLTIAGGENGLQISSGGTSPVSIQGGGGASGVLLADDSAGLGVNVAGEVGLTVNSVPVFLGDANGIAFLGKLSTVGVQSITGATEQEQIDSIVAALVAFGFATNDR